MILTAWTADSLVGKSDEANQSFIEFATMAGSVLVANDLTKQITSLEAWMAFVVETVWDSRLFGLSEGYATISHLWAASQKAIDRLNSKQSDQDVATLAVEDKPEAVDVGEKPPSSVTPATEEEQLRSERMASLTRQMWWDDLAPQAKVILAYLWENPEKEVSFKMLRGLPDAFQNHDPSDEAIEKAIRRGIVEPTLLPIMVSQKRHTVRLRINPDSDHYLR